MNDASFCSTNQTPHNNLFCITERGRHTGNQTFSLSQYRLLTQGLQNQRLGLKGHEDQTPDGDGGILFSFA